MMKRHNQNNPQAAGYPPQNGYSQEAYQGGMPYQGYPVSQGYQTMQGYPQSQPAAQAQGYPQSQPVAQAQGYPQSQPVAAPQGYPQSQPVAAPQGYPQSQPVGYPQSQPAAATQGYSQARSYQTPQVTGSQPAAGSAAASSAYTGQGAYTQPGYQQGFTQTQNGYPGPGYSQQAGYQQGYNTNTSGYSYPGYQAPTGSYIPQTPYSQGYTSSAYQAPADYAQGYSAYNQMGRSPQTAYNPQQEMSGQVPLNTGGYIPQPVPVRKRPFVFTDAYLLILSAALLILFAAGMFVPGLGLLKWVFLICAAGSIALFWIKPLIAGNKRLCYTIVFGLLALVAVIGFVTGGTGGRTEGRTTDVQQTGSENAGGTGAEQANPFSETGSRQEPSPTPSVTNTPDANQNSDVTGRLDTFFNYWMVNNQDGMLSLCSPTWASKQENTKTALFSLIMNRTPLDFEFENISGTPNDDNRTVTLTTKMDRNNGKEPVRYRMNVMMVKENDGLWYVDPQSLQSNDKADTPDPSITETPGPTPTPATYPDTPLYYNPSGGEYYHRDQNCKRINERYLPLKGKFTYSELDKFPDLKPCSICGAPSRPN